MVLRMYPMIRRVTNEKIGWLVYNTCIYGGGPCNPTAKHQVFLLGKAVRLL